MARVAEAGAAGPVPLVLLGPDMVDGLRVAAAGAVEVAGSAEDSAASVVEDPVVAVAAPAGEARGDEQAKWVTRYVQARSRF